MDAHTTIRTENINTTPSESPASFMEAVKLVEDVPANAWHTEHQGADHNRTYFSAIDGRIATSDITPTFFVEVDVLTGSHVSRTLEYRTVADGNRKTESFTGPEIDVMFEKVRNEMLESLKGRNEILEALSLAGLKIAPDAQLESE